MSEASRTLTANYATALRDHLNHPGEAALHNAYALGRTALSNGLGVLDMAAFHHAALLAVAADDPVHGQQIAKAAEFFAESLSPFEMSLRGYREANTRLTTLNAALQHANTAAETANRELEAFSYSVAHDLRAPLRALDGFSQALLEDYRGKLDAEGARHLQYVRESAQEMAELIDGLLALSRVSRGELKRERLDLTGLARGIAAKLQRAEPDRVVEFAAADGIITEGDPRLLKLVLENLLGNAWKFTRKRPRARIEFGRLDDEKLPTCFVRDNGAGFDMAYAAKLFGVFQRLHSSRDYEGTGIGLATVQRIIARHGGRVWADGAVDSGATFYFSLGNPFEGANTSS
jgi:light-regulated signal transduction histidine kinase (bacteriophytochrome)